MGQKKAEEEDAKPTGVRGLGFNKPKMHIVHQVLIEERDTRDY
jgi:hypothetical protein